MSGQAVFAERACSFFPRGD